MEKLMVRDWTKPTEGEQTAACWCQGCGVFHWAPVLDCVLKDDQNYVFPNCKGKDPVYDEEVIQRMTAKYGGRPHA